VKVLTTLTRPDGGRGEVAGRDVVREPDAMRRSAGYVRQSSGADRDAIGRESPTLQGHTSRA
jgi:ABC-2 type transport system ATP-binding protein